MIYRLAIVGAIVIACAGCAAGQRANESRAIATEFLAAMDAGDTRAACALLATDTRDELEFSEGEPCAASLASVEIAGGTVEEVAVWGDRAKAGASTGTLFLVQLDVGWRVAAAGCVRGEGEAYDCLLAA